MNLSLSVLYDYIYQDKEINKALMIDCVPDECSVSCGGGERQCRRTCEHGTFGDVGCPSEDELKIEVCNEQPCRMYTKYHGVSQHT